MFDYTIQQTAISFFTDEPVNGPVVFSLFSVGDGLWFNPDTGLYDSPVSIPIDTVVSIPDIPLYFCFFPHSEAPSTFIVVIKDNNTVLFAKRLHVRFGKVICERNTTFILESLSDLNGPLFTSINRISSASLINTVEDDIVRDQQGNKLSCVLYGYDSPENAQLHDQSTGLCFRMQFNMEYDGNYALSLFKSYMI